MPDIAGQEPHLAAGLSRWASVVALGSYEHLSAQHSAAAWNTKPAAGEVPRRFSVVRPGENHNQD